ncbi:MAG: oligosaccharide repeat unit polymerase [Lachnospiraceae bacterium]|nr:oligosaccharide repeat unit polymerase [Lachnospiraceae bacterium]
MAIILLAVFLILFLIEYRLQKNFVSPVSLLLLSFIMGFFFISINTVKWGVHLNLTFVIYIFSAVAAFALGAFIVETLGRKTGPGMQSEEGGAFLRNKGIPKLHEKYPALILLIISAVCVAVYYAIIFKRIGLSGGIETVLVRANKELNRHSSSFLMHQMIEIVIAIGKINVLELFLLKYLGAGKDRIKKYSLIFLQLVFTAMGAVLSADRNIILRFFIYTMCLWIFFEVGTRKESLHKVNLKIFARAAVCVVLFALLFFALGKMRRATSDFSRMMGIYGGGGLYNFNLHLLKEPEYSYGKSTFLLLDNTLQFFGIPGNTGASESIVVDEFITYKMPSGFIYSANIYSAMRPYADDFGLIGVIVFSGFLGVFFELLYVLAKRYRFGFMWAFYALTIYPVVYFTVAEQFFRRLHLGIVYELGWFLAFYLLIFVFKREEPDYGRKHEYEKSIA